MYNLFHLVAIAATAVIVVIVLLAREQMEHEQHAAIINGYWDASRAFCARSGIESAQIYFQDDKVYLLVDDGDHIVLNKCVDVDLSPQWWGADAGVSAWHVRFGEDVSPLPQECEMRIDPRRGMLGLFQDDTLYLEAFKDNKASVGVI